MPKKIAPNSKSEEAKARKEAVKQDKAAKEAKAKEDAKWTDQGPQGKAAKKKQDEERKRQEAAAKKAETERLKREEEQEMARISKKGVKGQKTPDAPSKVTRAELDRQKEEDSQKREEAERQRRKQAARVQEEAEYARVVNVANTNRMDASVDARSLDDAVSQLSVVTLEEQAAMDKHPEKRLRAAYRAYEESELARLRQDSPGLTLTQYKELIWKSWKKSPQNPLNQSPVR